MALLEYRSIVDQQLREVGQLRSGEALPAMDPHRRAEKVAELDEAIARYRAKIHELEPAVGDPEDVPDASGSLPADRRFTTLYHYRQIHADRGSRASRVRGRGSRG